MVNETKTPKLTQLVFDGNNSLQSSKLILDVRKSTPIWEILNHFDASDANSFGRSVAFNCERPKFKVDQIITKLVIQMRYDVVKTISKAH